MKGALLILAGCLVVQVADGQDRQWRRRVYVHEPIVIVRNTHRDAVRINRHLTRHVNRDIRANVMRDIRRDFNRHRTFWRYDFNNLNRRIREQIRDAVRHDHRYWRRKVE